jgi:hypothetical protein
LQTSIAKQEAKEESSSREVPHPLHPIKQRAYSGKQYAGLSYPIFYIIPECNLSTGGYMPWEVARRWHERLLANAKLHADKTAI